MPTEDANRIELLQGTLDLLILQTLRLGPAHGHTIMQAIKQSSDDVLQVEQGSLYPALHRLIKRGWIDFEHGTSENNRRAKYLPPDAKGTQATRHRDLEVGEARASDRAGAEADMRRRGRESLDSLDDEIRDHILRETEENIARGMTPDEASAAARRAFGNATLTKEAARTIWIPVWWDQSPPGHPIRPPSASPRARLQHRRRAYACTRDRFEHRRVQRRQRGAGTAAGVSAS